MRIYREHQLSDRDEAPPQMKTPVAYAVFPKEVVAAPERWIDETYHVVQRTEMPRGGHFAALEQPDLMVQGHSTFFCQAQLTARLTQNSGEMMNPPPLHGKKSDDPKDNQGDHVGKTFVLIAARTMQAPDAQGGGWQDALSDRGSDRAAPPLTARDAENRAVRSMEIFPRVQTLAKPQSPRVAIKVKGKILFIDLGDVVSVQAKGKCVWLQRHESSYLLRESISVVAERLETHGFIRIHRSVLVNTSLCTRNQAALDGGILSSSRWRKGIHGHPHLQEESQIPGGILDRHGCVVPWLKVVFACYTSQPLVSNGLVDAEIS